MLRDKQLLPVVCFVFSRKRCDDYLELVKGLDLNSQEDKHYISQFFRQALSRLNESDRQLQQVIELLLIFLILCFLFRSKLLGY
jgi:antiviral helicase SKI2